MATERAPGLERLGSINVDGSRKHPQPADVKGRFIRWRRVVYAILIAIYAGLPFVKIGGYPAMQLDVAARRFYLFGSVFNAQDFWRVALLVVIGGVGLLFLTAWVGRVWCGWACPQTVFLEGVYRRIERFFEGSREKRIRLLASPWTPEKIARKTGKHVSFLLVSMALAHVAMTFFVTPMGTLEMVLHGPAEHWTAFLWMSVITLALYFNFAWFREQLCIVVCPYGRLQSVLLDRDSLIIGYDVARGEPRGKVRKRPRKGRVQAPVLTPLGIPSTSTASTNTASITTSSTNTAPTSTPSVAAPEVASGSLTLPSLAQSAAAAVSAMQATGETTPVGDCVDCDRCVTVCPTGIDIRNGTQMECIACAQCIDACDDVMTRLGRPKGLIRYDSQNGLEGTPKRLFRPRLAVYGAMLAVASVIFLVATVARQPFEANPLRVRGAPYLIENGSIRNQFELHLVNKNPVDSELSVEVRAPIPLDVTLARTSVTLEPLGHFRLPVFLVVKHSDWKGPFEVTFHITDSASKTERDVKARFLGPAAGSASLTGEPNATARLDQ